VQGYDLRVKSIIFKNSYEKNLEDIDVKIKTVDGILDYFKTGVVVQEWLKIILAYGNYLNGTSNRGGAYGFKLDNINKLGDIKSNDNKKTLLSFIVEGVMDGDNKDILEVNQVDPNNSIALVSEMSRELTKSFASVVKLNDLSKNITDTNDKTTEFLGNFYEKCNTKINKQNNDIKSLETKYESLANFYGENPKDCSYDQFIEIFNKFFKDVSVRFYIIKYTY